MVEFFSSFFSFLKVFVVCGSLFFIVMLVLLSLPQSRLRCVGLELSRYALGLGLILLIPLPTDVLPDVVPPITYLDDVGYAIAAVLAARSGLAERKKRLLYDEIELKELQAKAGKEG